MNNPIVLEGIGLTLCLDAFIGDEHDAAYLGEVRDDHANTNTSGKESGCTVMLLEED